MRRYALIYIVLVVNLSLAGCDPGFTVILENRGSEPISFSATPRAMLRPEEDSVFKTSRNKYANDPHHVPEYMLLPGESVGILRELGAPGKPNFNINRLTIYTGADSFVFNKQEIIDRLIGHKDDIYYFSFPPPVIPVKKDQDVH